MSNLSDPGETSPAPPPGPGSSLPIGRTAIVLILFVIVTAVLVEQLHPTSSSTTATTTATSSSSSTTATTTHGTTATKGKSTTSTTTPPPASVGVLVANGSNVAGAATKVATELKANGWNTLTAVDTTASVASSTVYYAPGYMASATSIATSLAVPTSAVQPLSTSVPVATVTGADVLVVVGPDIAGKPVIVTPTTVASAVTTTTKAH